MALQPPTGISLECLKKQATKDMLILFVRSFLLVPVSILLLATLTVLDHDNNMERIQEILLLIILLFICYRTKCCFFKS